MSITAEPAHSQAPRRAGLRRMFTAPASWVRACDTGLAVAATAVIVTGLFVVLGYPPGTVYPTMLRASLSGPGLVTTVQQAIPVIGLGLALSFCFRAGQFNLGGDGQFVAGGLAGTVVALYLPGPGWIAIAVALVAAAAGGALAATASALAFTRFEAPVFATSLLLNFPIIALTSYLINTALADPASKRDATASIPADRRVAALVPRDSAGHDLLESWFGSGNVLTLLAAGVNWSVLVVATVFVICVFVNNRLPIGYETALIGLNPRLAAGVGVRTGRAVVVNMATGGAIAGLVGVLVVLGSHFRLIDGGLNGTGFAITALLVVLLARTSPVAVVLAGFLFTALGVGAAQLERDYGLSSYVSTVVQALVVFLVSLQLTPAALVRRWGVRR
ncbi:ABC transporter permease [Nocardia speluncae]|uniref:ABC transporter permease n=1 Tax=Nocardia speluncae TaxID=419477 RepID=A0A846XFH7_9NOCA|nr:ABC transporter permease [Nocardia speluncae]NKY33480.1 ABC transporter permease [Nocardia speluncae]